MLARRIDPPAQPRQAPQEASATARAHGRWRRRGRRPTRGPHGDVCWWERPAPRGDTRLWAAVQRLQERRLACGMSVQTLADRLAQRGRPLRRETLSRVLNGKQRTSWETAEMLAEVLRVDLDDLLAEPDDGPEDATIIPLSR